MPTPDVEVSIERIGAHGDGIAEHAGRRLYIPLTVAGDRVRARVLARRGDGFAAEVVDIVAMGPERATPPCPHFGRCGGCSLQHLDDESYARWKVARLIEALGRVGLDGFKLEPLLRTAPGDRRRASFAALGGTGRGTLPRLGFNTRRSRDVVDITVCPVLDPRIVSLLPELRRLLATVLAPGERAVVTVTHLDGGLDVLIDRSSPLDLDLRQRLARFAVEAGVARVSWRPLASAEAETVVQHRPLGAVFDRTFVPVPPGSFLQASAAAEAALIAMVRTTVGAARRVADLFCGVGTFSLPLASAGACVLAVDDDAAGLAALAAGARTIPARVSVEHRDLFARPLNVDELRRFDAVVVDPPRAGARRQAELLAASTVRVVAMVSCDPDTFARDARILADGGFCFESVQPVDQFLWSPHLELVACFRR